MKQESTAEQTQKKMLKGHAYSPGLQKLPIQVRRASAADQIEVLKWLQAKFSKL